MAIKFIYKPCSGSRICASKECPTIALLRWNNGCCHVVGGLHLVLRPQGTRAGREVVRKLVQDFVEHHGGVGWDEQGCVQVVLPGTAALLLVKTATSLSSAGILLDQKLDLADLGAQLFVQGLATVTANGRFEPVGWAPEEPPLNVESTYWEGERLVVLFTGGARVTVPGNWAGLAFWGREMELPARNRTSGDESVSL